MSQLKRKGLPDLVDSSQPTALPLAKRQVLLPISTDDPGVNDDRLVTLTLDSISTLQPTDIISNVSNVKELRSILCSSGRSLVVRGKGENIIVCCPVILTVDYV